jgi:hypothetical protein
VTTEEILYTQVKANMTEVSNYSKKGKKSCFFDIHLKNTAPKIYLTVKESAATQGRCLSMGQSLTLSVHRKTDEDETD